VEFLSGISTQHRGQQTFIKVPKIGDVSMVDVEKALLDPGLVFKTPQDLFANDELSRQQKIDILRRWEYDARQLQVAEEESMEGPQPVMVDAVLRALRAIGAPADSERCGPTKQGEVVKGNLGAFQPNEQRQETKLC
jgi:hypothetical protein